MSLEREDVRSVAPALDKYTQDRLLCEAIVHPDIEMTSQLRDLTGCNQGTDRY